VSPEKTNLGGEPSEDKLTAALDRFRAHHASFMDKYKD